MHQLDEVSENLRKLFERGPESSGALEQLSQIALLDGLSEPELNMVLDIVFDYSLRNSLRLTLISNCLVPNGEYLIQPDVISRILGAVGVSEVYFRNGKQFKLKRLSPASQNLLLEWLICGLHLFGKALFEELHRLLPTLFGLLSFEYLRANIATLIIIGLSQQRKAKDALTGQKRYALKPWHVDVVMNLSSKFPFDPYIRSLIIFMKRLSPTLDIGNASEARGSRITKMEDILYPNKELMELLSAKLPSSDMWEMKEVKDKIQRLFDSFTTPASKRRKLFINSFNDLDLLESADADTVSIGTVESLQTLVDEFDRISMANPGSLFTLNNITNERLRRYFVAFNLMLAHNELPFIKKLALAIHFHALSSLSSELAFEQLRSIAQLGTFEQLISPIQQAIETNSVDFARQIRLLSLIPPSLAPIQIILDRIENDSNQEHWRSLFSELSKTFNKWNVLHNEYGFFQDVYLTIYAIVEKTFPLAEKKWLEFTLLTKLSFLALLRAIKHVNFADSSEPRERIQLLPSPTLYYQMIMSINPFILSEALGYIAFLRTLKFEEGGEALKLRNNYIMDSINLVWLDQAFKLEASTFNKGMYLDAEYLKKLAGLSFFSYSDLIELKNVGGLSHNPGTSYLAAEIMWSLEDGEEEINVRHPGPLSEESVSMLQQNPDLKWLLKSYFEIKVSLLNKLDNLGFSGIGDLLFSSLRPLASLRQKKRISVSET